MFTHLWPLRRHLRAIRRRGPWLDHVPPAFTGIAAAADRVPPRRTLDYVPPELTDATATFVAMGNVLGGIQNYDNSGGYSGPCHAAAASHVLGSLKLKSPKPVPKEAGRLLRIGWQTELAAEVVNEIDDDLLRRVSAQTLPVQAYYAVFNVARAATKGAGVPCESHMAVHNDWASQRAAGGFRSWGVTLSGDPKEADLCSLSPPIVEPYGFNPMEQSHRAEAYVWAALRMTRKWKLEATRDEWLKKNKRADGTFRKNLPAKARTTLCAQLRPTTLMDFLYELRCRANYRGVEEYGSDADDSSVRAFHSGLLHLADLGLLHYEALLARHVGLSAYSGAVDGWVSDTAKVGSWATRRVERRLKAIRAAMATLYVT